MGNFCRKDSSDLEHDFSVARRKQTRSEEPANRGRPSSLVPNGARFQEKLKEVYAQLDSPAQSYMKNKQQDAPEDNESKINNLTT